MADRLNQRGVYIVAASARVAEQRVRTAVIAGRSVEAMITGTHVGEGDSRFLQRNARSGSVHLWAVRGSVRIRQVWSSVAPGDWVIFFSRGVFRAVARVAETREAQPIAVLLWGAEDGPEYPLLLAFDEVYATDKRASGFAAPLGRRFLGFRRVSDDRASVIKRRYGSIDGFIFDQFLSTADDAINSQR